MACDWDSASRIRSGSITTVPRPLFWRYCEIMIAAACASSLAPGTDMSAYIDGCWTGASLPAQPASSKVIDIAAAARMYQEPPNEGPLLHTNRG